MATKFSEIYEKALWKIRDYESLVRSAELSETMYRHLLMSAIADVHHYVPLALTFRESEHSMPEVKQYVFDETLPLEVQELLALGVVVKWLESQFLNSDALKKGMFNKDYKEFGLDADRIAELYHAMRRMFEGKAKTMSFRHSEFERLKPT